MLARSDKPRRWPADWLAAGQTLWAGAARMLGELAPKGLYARALIIIIAPIVLLESVVAFAFMERHWNQVTRRLSEGTARNIAAIVDLYEVEGLRGQPAGGARQGPVRPLARRAGARRAAQGRSAAAVLRPARPRASRGDCAARQAAVLGRYGRQVLARGDPDQAQRCDPALHRAARARLRLQLPHLPDVDGGHVRVPAHRGDPVPAQCQIRPILRLAEAADEFGKGRPVPPDFRPRGAREVRQAAQAFLEMRDRIRHHVEQRTTMLAGVSHDLRTVLTRFKLELALLGDGPEIAALRNDVNEMQHMLEDYLAFAKGDGGEEAAPTSVGELLEEINEETLHYGTPVEDPRSASPAAISSSPQAAGVQARHYQPGNQRHPLRRLRGDPRQPGRGVAAHRGRRRRAGHPAGRARQRVPAVLPARQRAQPGHGQHRARARDRPRHRAQPRRRDSARRKSSMGGLRATVRVPL